MAAKIFKIVLIYFLTVLLDSNGIHGEICTNSIHTFEKHLGTKTPYRFVANNTFGQLEYEGCKPMKVWMMVRHGTRTPSAPLIRLMQTRLPEIRDQILENNPTATDYLHNSDLESFRKWKSKLNEEDNKKLTHEGEDEMVGLAERMQSKFPSIFDKAYSNSSYKFKYTDTQRTRKSAKQFAVGLFGKKTASKVWFPEPSKKDPILRFYKLCTKWRVNIKKNENALLERRKFENSTIMKQTISEVAERLQLADHDLNFADVYAMYAVCAFETAWNRRDKSPWCTPFTVENMKILEYAEDLKYYWIDGYGHELTYKQACTAFNDIMSIFKSADKFPKATVYFTHSGTLLKMLAHMGLYREGSPLKADNYRDNLEHRKWRVSLIDAFGTNIAFVLHKCEDEKQKILMLHQEQVVRIPPCPHNDLCDMEDLTNYYKNSIEKCFFDEMCEYP